MNIPLPQELPDYNSEENFLRLSRSSNDMSTKKSNTNVKSKASTKNNSQLKSKRLLSISKPSMAKKKPTSTNESNIKDKTSTPIFISAKEVISTILPKTF